MFEVFAIILLVFIVFSRTFSYQFIVDDNRWYEYIKNGGASLGNINGLMTFIKYRLYGAGTFGLNTTLDHAFTTSLHALACVLIYYALGTNQISFWAAMLYAVNPINNQTSVWLNGRRYLINIILVLTMLCLAKITPFAVIPYLFTPLFQVSAIFAPILLIDKSPIFLVAIPLFVLLSYRTIVAKVTNRLKGIVDDDRKIFKLNRLTIITKYYGHYFFKMLFPGTCMIIYKRLHYWGITEEGNKDAYSFNLDFYRGILAISLSAFGVFLFKGDLLCMWFFMVLSTLQWCAIIPVVHDLADRYASLPNVFMMFFVSFLAHTYLSPFAIPLICFLIGAYLIDLNKVMVMYKDFNSYWFYHRFHSLETPAPRTHEINWLIKRNDMLRAWVLTREGLDVIPKDYKLLFQAAILQRNFGNYEIARNFTKQAMDNRYFYQKDRQAKEVEGFLKTFEHLGVPVKAGSSSPDRLKRRAERMVAV